MLFNWGRLVDCYRSEMERICAQNPRVNRSKEERKLLPVEFLFQPREVQGSGPAPVERHLGTAKRMHGCLGRDTPSSPSTQDP